MSTDLVLTQDELAFIREMDFDSGLAPSLQNLTLDVGGDERANLLLDRLGLADELKLVAQFRHHKLMFPVALVQDEFAQFKMELRSPEIFELGSQLRNWRHKLDTPIKTTCRLAKQTYELDEISSTGLCVDIDELFAPEQLELDVVLPECGTNLQISAKRVRGAGQGRVAYSIDLISGARDRLRRFLFKRHRETFE